MGKVYAYNSDGVDTDQSYKEHNLELHTTALCALCPMFFVHNYTDYTQYVPVYMITLLNLSDTHPRCKELLEQRWFSVSQTSILCLRNAFDITIKQTLLPYHVTSRYYRFQQLDLRFVQQIVYYSTHQSSVC